MKLYNQLFIVVIVTTCQANRLPVYPRQLARQGVLYPPYDKSYELDPKTPLIPDSYKPGYLRTNVDHVRRYPTYHNPVWSREAPEIHSRAIISLANRQAILAEIDREALSKISEEDRQLLLTKLSLKDRQALLTKLDDFDLNENYPINQNRFGLTSIPTIGFSGAAAQIGAGAGGYIGGKLAGPLGAKLGAAAGAYLGAAAASKLHSTVKSLVSFGSSTTNSTNSISSKEKPTNVNYGYGSYGAVVVKKE